MKTKRVLLPPPLAPFAEFGLTLEVLVNAILAGEQRRSDATKHHPVTAGGIFCWAERVRSLRDALVPLGWVARDRRNLPTVATPDGRREIGTTPGDENTSLRGRDAPRTRYARGIATQDAIRRNQRLLFGDGFAGDDDDEPEFWILLTHRVLTDDGASVRWELSRPDEFTETGIVCSWSPRCPFEEIDLGPQISPQRDFTEGEDIDLDVRPKRKK
jgi:hypothetical protein